MSDSGFVLDDSKVRTPEAIKRHVEELDEMCVDFIAKEDVCRAVKELKFKIADVLEGDAVSTLLVLTELERVFACCEEDMNKFLDKVISIADKGAEFTLNVGGELYKLLFGDSETKGILKMLLDLPGTITKNLGINLNIQEPEGMIAKAILVLASAKVGGPLLAGAVTAAILAQEGRQAALTPGAPGYQTRDEIGRGSLADLGRILDNVVTLITGRDKPLHPGYGSLPGETEPFQGIGSRGLGYGMFTVVLENKTGTPMNATSANNNLQLNLV